ncbi:MAG TPA: hypothetical protein PL105_01390 [Caldilineaceae bacterium]|nr:hypothetical protein [Caldilineaceae bacterium]
MVVLPCAKEAAHSFRRDPRFDELLTQAKQVSAGFVTYLQASTAAEGR